MIQLSHTQMETWKHCRYQWSLRYVRHVPSAPSEALAYGSAFHTAAEYGGREKMAGRVVTSTTLVDVALAAYAQEMHGDATGFLSSRYAQVRTNLAVTLPALADRILPQMHPQAVEEAFALVLQQARYTKEGTLVTASRVLTGIDKGQEPSHQKLTAWAEQMAPRASSGTPWELTLTQARFTGRIDLLTATQTIVDYKTGKPWELDAEHEKEQAAAYLLARPEARRVTFVVFPIEQGHCEPQIRATTRTELDLAHYRHQALATAETIEQAKQRGAFPANPGYLCGWCDVLGSCDMGQKWLAARQRKAAVPVVSAG